jgi:hypothetical protein
VKDFLGEVGIPVFLESSAEECVCIVEKLEISGGFLQHHSRVCAHMFSLVRVVETC